MPLLQKNHYSLELSTGRATGRPPLSYAAGPSGIRTAASGFQEAPAEEPPCGRDPGSPVSSVQPHRGAVDAPVGAAVSCVSACTSSVPPATLDYGYSSVSLFLLGLALVLVFAEQLVESTDGTAGGFGVSAFLIGVVFIGFDPENLFSASTRV